MLEHNVVAEIDALITKRILEFRKTLIETGQIKEVSRSGPQVIPPVSHYNRRERMQGYVHLEDPALHQCEPLQTN